VFGADLGADAAFRADVTRNVVSLFKDGVRATVARHLLT
jgi:hypothetical protein